MCLRICYLLRCRVENEIFKAVPVCLNVPPPLPPPPHPKWSSWFFKKQRWANKWHKRKICQWEETVFDWRGSGWTVHQLVEKSQEQTFKTCVAGKPLAPPLPERARSREISKPRWRWRVGQRSFLELEEGISPYFGGCFTLPVVLKWHFLMSAAALTSWNGCNCWKKISREHAHWKINPLEGVGELSYCNFSAVGCSKQLL